MSCLGVFGRCWAGHGAAAVFGWQQQLCMHAPHAPYLDAYRQQQVLAGLEDVKVKLSWCDGQRLHVFCVMLRPLLRWWQTPGLPLVMMMCHDADKNRKLGHRSIDHGGQDKVQQGYQQLSSILTAVTWGAGFWVFSVSVFPAYSRPHQRSACLVAPVLANSHRPSLLAPPPAAS